MRDQHQVDSAKTRILCEIWIRSALTRLCESRLSLSGHFGSSDSSDLRSLQLPSLDVSSLSVSEYPKALLHSALIAIDDLRIDISPALLESVVPLLVTLGLVSPASPPVTHEDPTVIESRPSGKNPRNKTRERSLRPSSSATDGVQSSTALQPQQYLSFGGFDEFASASATSVPKQPASPRAHDISYSAFIALEQSAATSRAFHTHEGEAKHITDQILKSSEPPEHVWSLLKSFVFVDFLKCPDLCNSLHKTIPYQCRASVIFIIWVFQVSTLYFVFAQLTSDLAATSVVSLGRSGEMPSEEQFGMFESFAHVLYFISSPECHNCTVHLTRVFSSFAAIALRIGDFDKAHHLFAMQVSTTPLILF